ncbi:hypothetical protein [Dysgonomonas sp. 25]|uniref:hypothetical protein n=1 Tax=Dysgonomonas sp. 25 TaxID=2302933 RepID=UPI0013D67E6D|nr:hypothetical protein [Dysgonomonas sp. 25]NDV69940.1 hypothetical protein [Dysgonomonas sp. 25]
MKIRKRKRLFVHLFQIIFIASILAGIICFIKMLQNEKVREKIEWKLNFKELINKKRNPGNKLQCPDINYEHLPPLRNRFLKQKKDSVYDSINIKPILKYKEYERFKKQLFYFPKA